MMTPSNSVIRPETTTQIQGDPCCILNPRKMRTIPEATSSYASGVSADGNVVVGSYYVGANIRAFRWTACAVCRADFNLSGGLEVQDVFDFLAGWFAGDVRADFNQSGAVNVQDIFDFLAAWFAGC